MKIIPQIESLEDAKQFQVITKTVKIQFIQFQAITINRLADDLLLVTIHQRMLDFGYSPKIIAGTVIAGVNIISSKKFRIFVHSEHFGDNGFDVALAREQTGTKDHFIEPISTGSPFFDDGPKALNWDGNGFSKGHMVSGIIASHIIERTLDTLAELFLESYNSQKNKWLQQQYGRLAQIAI